MRISDWSSDVCSSDLTADLSIPRLTARHSRRTESPTTNLEVSGLCRRQLNAVEEHVRIDVGVVIDVAAREAEQLQELLLVARVVVKLEQLLVGDLRTQKLSRHTVGRGSCREKGW